MGTLRVPTRVEPEKGAMHAMLSRSYMEPNIWEPSSFQIETSPNRGARRPCRAPLVPGGSRPGPVRVQGAVGLAPRFANPSCPATFPCLRHM